MTYRIIFDDQYVRTIPSCIIEARKTNGLANAIGTVMESYIQSQIALIVPGVLPYKIETINGNLAGVFSLQTTASGLATVLFSIIRPAFVADQSNITAEINTFIQSNNWVYDE
jgi:S1-C subfamily serine protease